MDNQNRIDEIRKKVSRTSLYIARLPEKTKTEFLKLANEEFERDYGFTLKWILDFRNGLLANPNQILSDKIDVLADQVKGLQEPKEKETGIKMISGKRIGGMKNESISSPSGQSTKV